VLLDTVSEFLSQALHCVLTIFRRDGAAQMSIVSCVLYQDGVGFTTSNDRAKLLNLWRYPHCSLLVSQEDWWGYVVLEGQAKILSAQSTPPEELHQVLREV